MTTPWLTHFNATLDKLETATRADASESKAIAEATHTLTMLESQLPTLSTEERTALQAHLPQLLIRLGNVTATLETERQTTATELASLRNRANALKSYGNK